MITSTHRRITIVLLCAVVGAGCNVRPDTPSVKWYESSIKVLDLDAGDPKEATLVADVETARRNYLNAIEALAAFYEEIGDLQKTQWAKRELMNLEKVQEFTWGGLDPMLVKPTLLPSGKNQHDLVENVLLARQQYRLAVDKLAEYYETKDEFKAHVVHVMQERFHPEDTFMYFLTAELPPQNLKPTRIYPKANQLYEKAKQLYLEGSRLPAMADYDKQREALTLFHRLVRNYPDSTRIALSAFYIGEIYKEYFREHYLAVLWYERALMWDPLVPKPVRFQAAVQYDFNLDDKINALEYYKAAVSKEPWFKSNRDYSLGRIKEIEKILAQRKPLEEEAEPAEPEDEKTPEKEKAPEK